MSAPIICITGSSGFIGSSLCTYLLENNFSVRGTYRTKTPYLKWLEEKYSEKLTLFQFEFSDPKGTKSSWEDLLAGVDSLIHVAGLVKDWGSVSSFQRMNVEVTHVFAEKAKQFNVCQMIYISSIAVHGTHRHLQSCTEEGPYYPPRSAYARTKKQAEEDVILLNQKGFHTLSLRPGNVYGPADHTTFFPLFAALESGKIAYIDQGKYRNPLLYIDDLIQAIVLCTQKRHDPLIHGKCYNITSDNAVTWKDFLDYAAELLCCKKPGISVPYRFAYSVAGVMECFAKFLHFQEAPPLTRYRIAAVGREKDFCIQKAREILGYQPEWSSLERFKRGLETAVSSYQRIKNPNSYFPGNIDEKR